MARRIRVPGIVDLILVSEASEIRALNEEARVDRNFIARGPLLNRLIARRIRWFAIAGLPLPSLARRGDAVRAERQRTLAAAIDPARRVAWTDAQIGALCAYVCGAADADAAAVVTQQIVGGAFDPLYRADGATWKAARLIDRFRDGFSPIEILWRLTGKLRRARALLAGRAGHDRWAMHGTAIGVHGIVQALARMRALRASPTATSLGDDAVLARSLAPPKQVPRTVEARFETPLASTALHPGALVVLQLEATHPQAPDAEMVFMRGHWNACPARDFVTELLRAVWRRSLREPVVR